MTEVSETVEVDVPFEYAVTYPKAFGSAYVAMAFLSKGVISNIPIAAIESILSMHVQLNNACVVKQILMHYPSPLENNDVILYVGRNSKTIDISYERLCELFGREITHSLFVTKQPSPDLLQRQ